MSQSGQGTIVVPNELVRTDYNQSELFANPCGYTGVQAGMAGLFLFYSHVASVIFTGFSTQMSATNILFTYLLFVGTNILILLRRK